MPERNDDEHNDEKEKAFSEVTYSHTVPAFTRPSYVYVLPAIFMFFLVVFGLFPLTSQVHIRQVCHDLNEDDCESSRVSANASTLNLIAAFALSIPSIFTCGIYGSVADVYGRKIVMIIPFLGLMIYSLCYLYVDTYDPPSYVGIIIAGNFMMGMSGGYFTFIMSCMCYTSDATVLVPHTRKSVYSVTEATIFIPEVFGPVLTGLWATYFGFFVPLLLGVIVSGIAIVYVYFLPESLPPDAPSRSQPLKLSPFQTFTSIMFLFTYRFSEPQDETALRTASTSEGTEPKTEQSPLPIMGVSFFIFLMAALGQPSVRIVYVTHRFGWNSSIIGIYDGMEGLVVSLSMLFAPYVVHRLMSHKSPVKIMTWIQVGFAFRVLHWCLFGLMPNTAGIFALLPLLLFVGPLPPYMRTIVSNSVPAAQQAQIFAAFSALEGIAALSGPLYSAGYTLLVQEGAPWVIFEIMAGAAAVALAIATYVRSVPRLARHLPEVPEDGAELEVAGPGEHPAGGAGEVDALLEGLLDDTEGRPASRASRTSRVSADGERLVPVDTTTLLYRHLAHNSVASEAETRASVDHAKSNITSRLLAEQHNFDYHD